MLKKGLSIVPGDVGHTFQWHFFLPATLDSALWCLTAFNAILITEKKYWQKRTKIGSKHGNTGLWDYASYFYFYECDPLMSILLYIICVCLFLWSYLFSWRDKVLIQRTSLNTTYFCVLEEIVWKSMQRDLYNWDSVWNLECIMRRCGLWWWNWEPE